MKKGIILTLLLSLFLINFINACQYTEIEKYPEFGTWIYDDEGNYFGEPLIVKDFVSRYSNLEGCTPVPSFKIENQYNFPIIINLTYDIFHPHINQFFQEARSTFNREVSLEAYSSQKIDGTCLNIGNNEIPADSIKYSFLEPENLVLKKGDRERNRTICKICPNGRECLDDGASCTSNNDCGFGICNPDKKCGNFVDCSEGKKLCNQTNTCLIPSIKEVNEAYSCEWECNSNRFENGICKRSSNEIWTFWIILFLIFGVGAYFTIRAFHKKGWETKERGILIDAEEKGKEIISNAKENAKGIIKDAEKKLGKIEENLDEKKNQKEKLEKDLESIKEDAKLSREIKEELLKTNEEIGHLKLKKQEEIKELLETYRIRYGHEFILDNGYISFKKNWLNPSQKGEYFHIWRFEGHNKRKVKFGYEIHHKDFNKLNNDINNLQEITKEEHKKLHMNRFKN